MKELLKAEDIKACITAHIIRNPLWQDKDVNIFYIVNQMAGCFTKKSKSSHYKKFFNTSINQIKDKKEG